MQRDSFHAPANGATHTCIHFPENRWGSPLSAAMKSLIEKLMGRVNRWLKKFFNRENSVDSDALHELAVRSLLSVGKLKKIIASIWNGSTDAHFEVITAYKSLIFFHYLAVKLHPEDICIHEISSTLGMLRKLWRKKFQSCSEDVEMQPIKESLIGYLDCIQFGLERYMLWSQYFKPCWHPRVMFEYLLSQTGEATNDEVVGIFESLLMYLTVIVSFHREIVSRFFLKFHKLKEFSVELLREELFALRDIVVGIFQWLVLQCYPELPLAATFNDTVEKEGDSSFLTRKLPMVSLMFRTSVNPIPPLEFQLQLVKTLLSFETALLSALNSYIEWSSCSLSSDTTPSSVEVTLESPKISKEKDEHVACVSALFDDLQAILKRDSHSSSDTEQPNSRSSHSSVAKLVNDRKSLKKVESTTSSKEKSADSIDPSKKSVGKGKISHKKEAFSKKMNDIHHGGSSTGKFTDPTVPTRASFERETCRWKSTPSNILPVPANRASFPYTYTATHPHTHQHTHKKAYPLNPGMSEAKTENNSPDLMNGDEIIRKKGATHAVNGSKSVVLKSKHRKQTGRRGYEQNFSKEENERKGVSSLHSKADLMKPSGKKWREGKVYSDMAWNSGTRLLEMQIGENLMTRREFSPLHAKTPQVRFYSSSRHIDFLSDSPLQKQSAKSSSHQKTLPHCCIDTRENSNSQISREEEEKKKEDGTSLRDSRKFIGTSTRNSSRRASSLPPSRLMDDTADTASIHLAPPPFHKFRERGSFRVDSLGRHKELPNIQANFLKTGDSATFQAFAIMKGKSLLSKSEVSDEAFSKEKLNSRHALLQAQEKSDSNNHSRRSPEMGQRIAASKKRETLSTHSANRRSSDGGGSPLYPTYKTSRKAKIYHDSSNVNRTSMQHFNELERPPFVQKYTVPDRSTLPVLATFEKLDFVSTHGDFSRESVDDQKRDRMTTRLPEITTSKNDNVVPARSYENSDLVRDSGSSSMYEGGASNSAFSGFSQMDEKLNVMRRGIAASECVNSPDSQTKLSAANSAVEWLPYDISPPAEDTLRKNSSPSQLDNLLKDEFERAAHKGIGFVRRDWQPEERGEAKNEICNSGDDSRTPLGDQKQRNLRIHIPPPLQQELPSNDNPFPRNPPFQLEKSLPPQVMRKEKIVSNHGNDTKPLDTRPHNLVYNGRTAVNEVNLSQEAMQAIDQGYFHGAFPGPYPYVGILPVAMHGNSPKKQRFPSPSVSASGGLLNQQPGGLFNQQPGGLLNQRQPQRPALVPQPPIYPDPLRGGGLLQGPDALYIWEKNLKQADDIYMERNHKIWEDLGDAKDEGTDPMTLLWLRELEIDPSKIFIQKSIGVGSTSTVLKASWSGTDVAVKQFNTAIFNIKKDLLRELAIMSRVRHPNLVLLMGVVTQSQPHAVVTEYCAGGSLFDAIHSTRNFNFSWLQKLKIIIDVAKGCNYLHESKPKIIHRDLKSLNILLADPISNENGVPVSKVSDFGMSRITHEAGVLPITELAGTYLWMAPEVFYNLPYGEKVDIYSYGIVMYEVITGTVPYEGIFENPVAAAMAVARGLRPDLSKVPSDSPPQLNSLMTACWDQQPHRRPMFSQILRILQKVYSEKENPV